ncbi:MAG: type IV toxin-antitoxin system AbiEi family antitoxin [Micromonosporaceae bacterium]
MSRGRTAEDVFRGSVVIGAGDLNRAVLRGPQWRRLLRDVYVASHVEVDHAVLCRAAHLVIPPRAVIAGASAACLYGVDVLRPGAPVEVLTPPAARFGPVQGLRIRCEALPDTDVTRIGDLRVTTPERTAWDLARQRDLEAAVVALDAFARAGHVRTAQLRARLAAAKGRKGSRRAERAIGLMDSRAESPQESRLRVKLLMAGLPVPVAQFEVRHEGRFIARVDLAWPERRVAVEYDGAWHASAEQLERDRRRLNRLQNAGWLVLHVTAGRMRDDFPAVVAEIAAALAARRPR